MTFGGEGIKIWWRESTGGDFSRWGGMSEFLGGGGIPTSRENTGNTRVNVHIQSCMKKSGNSIKIRTP